MISRRIFIQQSAAVAVGGQVMTVLGEEVDPAWRMPEESDPHVCTWMSFIASYDIWEERQVPEVQKNLAAIARTIAQYEPVNMLVRKQDRAMAEELVGGSHKHPIRLIPFEMNDLWMRDTGPAFVLDRKGNKAAVNLNFNGWGEDQAFGLDAKVARFVAKEAGVPVMDARLVLEGGCFEVDGEGTAIMTESCILNDIRNPGKSKREVEDELKRLLGLDKILWLKGVKGKDITDGHTDFYARFVRPGVVVVSLDTDKDSYDYQVTRDNIARLKKATDARGKRLELIVLETPWKISTKFGTNDFAAGYVGYYVCNGAVIMQKFGDRKADRAAKEKLQFAFPDRKIEMLAINGLASGGGSIHCATQQEPRGR